MSTLTDSLFRVGIVPVITLPAPEAGPDLARALAAGGIPIAEITFRRAGAADAIRRIRAELPEVLTGAGTIINVALAREAVAAGAMFIVSPGLNPAVVEYCKETGVPIFPGVSTPSDVERALELGLHTLKFFPAEASGGTAMLTALAAPFPQVRFLPTGGITAANLENYARLPAVLAIGGSWMVPQDLVGAGDWAAIRTLAAEAAAAVHGFSFAHLGINTANPDEARAAANLLAGLGLPLDERSSSSFASSFIELLHRPGRGAKGHIALKVNSVERALAFLEARGFKPVEETKKESAGLLQVVYLEPELLGFAIHLLRNPAK